MTPSFGPISSYPIAAPDASQAVRVPGPACAIGTSWASGSWASTAWECLSWAGVAVVVPEPEQLGAGRPRRVPVVRRVLVGVGRLTIAAPALRGRGVLVIGARGGVAVSGPSLMGDGVLLTAGIAETIFHAEAVGAGTVFSLARKQAEPARRMITGSGTVVVKATVTAEGILTMPPDAMDTAWLDLQTQITEEDELLLAVLR